MISKIKHEKVEALSRSWLRCNYGRYCPILDSLDSYFQLLIVQSNGQNLLDIGPIYFIELLPPFQSRPWIKQEKVVALSRSCLGCYCSRCCPILDWLPWYFLQLIVQSNGQNLLDIGPIYFIELLPPFHSMISKIKHEKVEALSRSWLRCNYGRYCPILDSLDSYFLLLLVQSNGQNLLDIGPIYFIDSFPLFQSMS
jgi:hypothetical protein